MKIYIFFNKIKILLKKNETHLTEEVFIAYNVYMISKEIDSNFIDLQKTNKIE